MRLATNLIPFSQLLDRFVQEGYRQGLPLEERLALIASVEGIEGVTIGWPCEAPSGAALQRMVEAHGLKWVISEPDIYSEPRFAKGALSSPDASIRTAAMDRIKETIEAAEVLGIQKAAVSNRHMRALKRLKDTLQSIPGMLDR